MRFKLILSLKDLTIPKDYRGCIVSYFKHCLEESGKEYLEKYFSSGTEIKNYTWSLYFGKAKFLAEAIQLEEKKMILNFSTYSNEEGIIFFNAFMGQLKKSYSFGKNNEITLEKIEFVQEKLLEEREVYFKTLSHILVKERVPGKNKDLFLTFLDERWEEVLKQNLKYQTKNVFHFDPSYDIETLKIRVEEPFIKKTVVKSYGISVPVTFGSIYLEGEKYLLEYISKSGIGSKRSSGFGLLEKI